MRHIRFFATFITLAAITLAIPFIASAQTTRYKSYNQASQVVVGNRPIYGAQLGTWDPANSGSLDTGYVDTSGCATGCVFVGIENTGSAATGNCQMYAGANRDSGVTTDDWAIPLSTTFTVAAYTTTTTGTICPGLGTPVAGVLGISAPAPKHYRIYCAANTNGNPRAFMQCH